MRAAIAALAVAIFSAWGCTPPAVSQLQSLPELPSLAETIFDPASLPVTPHLLPYTEKRGYPEYVVGPGDVLEFTLRDVDLTVEQITVRPDSNISFGLVENLRAGGRSVLEIDDKLTEEMRKYLKNPKIDVAVLEFNSKRVSLLGSILAISTAASQTGQGQYPLSKKTTVLDLILQAGGTTEDAQLDKVQLVRSGKTYVLNLLAALSGNQEQNVILQAEDIVRVPGSGQLNKKVVVIGEVAVPNVYLLTEDASLLDAMGEAGGMTTTAMRDEVRVIRSTAEGPQMFAVNFDRITTNLDLRQNIQLQNNDIVFVPRTFLGDVVRTLDRVQPLLEVLLLPATFRDLYTTGGGLRLDTGNPPETGTNTIFTRALPGTSAPAAGKAAPAGKATDQGNRNEPPEEQEESAEEKED